MLSLHSKKLRVLLRGLWYLIKKGAEIIYFSRENAFLVEDLFYWDWKIIYIIIPHLVSIENK